MILRNARIQTQPMAIYSIEENHLGHITKKPFTTMPDMAIPQTRASRPIPVLSPRTIKQTGV